MHPYARSMMKVSAIQSALQTLYPGVGIAGEYSPKEYGNHQFSILQGGPVIEELGLGWSSLTKSPSFFSPFSSSCYDTETAHTFLSSLQFL